MQNLLNIATYKFMPLDGLPALRTAFRTTAKDLELRGTILLAPEGINCVLSGSPAQVDRFKQLLEEKLGYPGLVYKETWSDKSPFERMLVKIKKEIISLRDPRVEPHRFTGPSISPQKLKKWLDEKKEVVLLDVRNRYEVAVGTFENAKHLDVDTFTEFAEKAKALPPETKNKPIVMFCTGGIRCEKASPLFFLEGFKEVYQLDGGILKYFEECQGAHYRGNCFVFDWRLSVSPSLEPQKRSEDPTDEFGRHLQ